MAARQQRKAHPRPSCRLPRRVPRYLRRHGKARTVCFHQGAYGMALPPDKRTAADRKDDASAEVHRRCLRRKAAREKERAKAGLGFPTHKSCRPKALLPDAFPAALSPGDVPPAAYRTRPRHFGRYSPHWHRFKSTCFSSRNGTPSPLRSGFCSEKPGASLPA